MRTNFTHIIILLLLSSCGQSGTVESIDLDKTEKLMPLLDRLKFSKIELVDNALIINDTLIKFSRNSSNLEIYVADSIAVEDWTKTNKIPKDNLMALKDKIRESRNYRITKESNTYFFSEGGWIDSNFGKAYSKSNINNDETSYKFERIQSIKSIKNKPNWYEYYAD
jgi:hypothetical protein